MFICPAEGQDKAIEFISKLIQSANLTISSGKTLVSQFKSQGVEVICSTYQGEKLEPVGKPFEYLGLSFDGENKRIRQSTISGFYDKLSARVKKEVQIAASKLKNRSNEIPSAAEIFKIVSFDMIRNSYMQNRDPDPDEEFMGNFYTYAQLAAGVTGSSHSTDIFKDLGAWIKERARKYCVDEERKQKRLSLAA